MITLEHIYKSYGEDYVLEDVSFKFKKQGLYILRGKNGSGKTTLLNIMSGCDKRYQGTVVANKIFYLPFDKYLVKELTVKENMQLSKDTFKSFRDKSYKIGIENIANKKVSKLSLGERQKLGIYLALCSGYDIILLDEPLVGLDKGNKKQIIRILKKAAKSKLIIMASHDSVSDKDIDKIVLENGKLFGQEAIFDSAIKNDEEKINLKNSYKWGLNLNFKQLFSKLTFIISIVGLAYCQNTASRELDVVYDDFIARFSNDKRLYFKEAGETLSIDNFYSKIVYSLAREIAYYTISIYHADMYEASVVVKDKYIDNGFLFSSIYNFEGLNKNEIILQIDKVQYCNRNGYATCIYDNIVQELKGNYLEYTYDGNVLRYKIKDVIPGDSTAIYSSNVEAMLKEVGIIYNYSDYEYSVAVYSERLTSFYSKIYSQNHLLNFDFYQYYNDNNYHLFMVNEKDLRYLNNDINNNLIACSNIGVSCSAIDFGLLNSISYIDEYSVRNSIFYKKYSIPLEYDEIVISSALANYINMQKDNIINLRFYIDEEFYILDNVRIIDIIEDNQFTIYHDKYDYQLYKDRFNKYLKIEYVYSEKKLPEYQEGDLLEYSLIQEASTYLLNLLTMIKNFLFVISIVIIFALFIVEAKREKRHKEFYDLMYLNKVDNLSKVIIGYACFYLLIGVLFIKDLAIGIIYSIALTLFILLKMSKIKPRISWI